MVLEAQIDAQPAVPRHERRDRGVEEADADRGRHRDGEEPRYLTVLADRGARLFGVRDRALRVRIEALSLLGHRHPPRRAYEERSPQLLLERGELAAHRRRRDAESTCCFREAPGVGDANERRHGGEKVHPKSVGDS